MSETTGTEPIGEPDVRDAERDDPSIAGKPEIPAGRTDEPAEPPDDDQAEDAT